MAQRVLDLKQALEISAHCRRGLITAGPVYFQPAYSTTQLVQALLIIEDNARMDGPSREELTAANRRYAALNARFVKLAKKHGVNIDTIDDTD